MRKEKIFNCEFMNYEYLKEDENKKINLEYYMILNEEKNLYGIEILKKERSNTGIDVIERNSIINYTSDIEIAKDIIKCLAKGRVTPISLHEVMENFEKS